MKGKLNPNLFWYDFVDGVYRNADEGDKPYTFDEYYKACFGTGNLTDSEPETKPTPHEGENE